MLRAWPCAPAANALPEAPRPLQLLRAVHSTALCPISGTTLLHPPHPCLLGPCPACHLTPPLPRPCALSFQTMPHHFQIMRQVSCKEPYEWRQGTDPEWEFAPKVKASSGGAPFHVVAYDFGIKYNILRRLASFGCRITVVPASWPASEVLKMNPDGVFFSNGPVSG